MPRKGCGLCCTERHAAVDAGKHNELPGLVWHDGMALWGAPCAIWTLVCAAVEMTVLMQCIQLRIAVVDGRGSAAAGVIAVLWHTVAAMPAGLCHMTVFQMRGLHHVPHAVHVVCSSGVGCRAPALLLCCYRHMVSQVCRLACGSQYQQWVEGA